MKKIKSILFAIFTAATLSSCTIDSVSYGVGVTGVSYPSYRVVTPPSYRTHVHTSYHYDLRPDYVRYRRYYRSVPALRGPHCHR
jgi:hypothetical protein